MHAILNFSLPFIISIFDNGINNIILLYLCVIVAAFCIKLLKVMYFTDWICELDSVTLLEMAFERYSMRLSNYIN